MNIDKFAKFQDGDTNKIKNMVKLADSLRLDKEKPTDVTFAEIIKSELDLGVDDFYAACGVDPSFDTIENLFTTVDNDVRWLIPEVFRDALRLGYRQAPIWPSLIKTEEQTNGLQQVLPSINMSDATPRRVGEAETIGVGTLSYQSKKFDIHKFGRGIKVTDEVLRYVNLNVVSIYFQDFGMKMGLGVDTLAINTLINGEQADGSEAAPVVGIATPGDLAFRDILKIWIRMSKIGRTPKLFVGGEDMALDTMDLDQFSMTANNAASEYKLNVKMPLPQGSDYFIHGAIPTNQHLIVDPTAALIKLNAVPMMVESERIVSNQTQAWYASFTTGFAKIFTDACVIQDQSKNITTYPLPTEFDYAAAQMVNMT
jgi:hypothetical protein